jgi:hypothetical protein
MLRGFLLVALCTGSRSPVIRSAAMRLTPGVGHVGLESGVYFRKPPDTRPTKKRARPVRLPQRLLAHLRRWERLGISREYVVEWNGRPVARIIRRSALWRPVPGFLTSHRTF